MVGAIRPSPVSPAKARCRAGPAARDRYPESSARRGDCSRHRNGHAPDSQGLACEQKSSRL